MDPSEVLTVGLSTPVIGFIIVCVFILLFFIVKSLKSVNGAPAEKAEQAPTPPAPPVVIPTVAEVAIQDDAELIAVITATIAFSLQTTSDKLIVRSFRKVSQWNDVIKREQQNDIFK